MELDLDQARAEFARDGFLIFPGFLDAQQLRELDERVERYLDRGNLREDLNTRKDFAGTLKNLNADDAWFAEQLEHGLPAQMVAAVLDDELDPATAAYFDRIPGEDRAINPHFDAIGHRRMGATLWIALDESTKENGCLYYARGSHKLNIESAYDLPGFDESTDGATAIELKPGDAALHSSLTVHWSNPNRSTHHRRGMTFFYWAASSKPSINSKTKWPKRGKV